MKTRERKDAEIVAIATGLLLGTAVVLAGAAVLYALRHALGVGDGIIDPLVSAVLVAAMVVTADHVHRHRR